MSDCVYVHCSNRLLFVCRWKFGAHKDELLLWSEWISICAVELLLTLPATTVTARVHRRVSKFKALISEAKLEEGMRSLSFLGYEIRELSRL